MRDTNKYVHKILQSGHYAVVKKPECLLSQAYNCSGLCQNITINGK